MKKAIIGLASVVMLFMFVAPNLFADADDYHVYSENQMGLMGFGIKGGLSESKFTGSDVSSSFGSNIKYRPSGAAGLFVTYRLSDMFAASLEPMWVQRGIKYNLAESDGVHNFSTRIDYVDVPLLAKVYIPTSSNFRPNLFVGPTVAFRIAAKEKETGPSSFSTTTDIKNSVKSTDFGLAFGAGTRYDIGQGAITLDGRYYAGLTKIDNTGANRTIRNGDFLVLVGYSFK